MEVIKFSDVPNIVFIIKQLLKQKTNGRKFSCESDEEIMHFTIDETGELVIYDVKTEQGEIYIMEFSECKNGRGGKCNVSIYSANLEKLSAEEFSRESFEDEYILRAKANAARFARAIKLSDDIGTEIWGPLFSRRIMRNKLHAYDK